MTTKKKRPAKRTVKAATPCKTCGGIGVIFPHDATVERCDTCRKYADDYEASHAAEQKMRLYDKIMAERPPKEDT